jgi:Ca2+-binding EF-hand superfamily protein
MNSKILLSVAALMLGSAVAAADDNPQRPKFDTNGDGSIDLAELQAVRPNATVEHFNAADQDHNGLLSRDELRDAARAMRGPPIDTNNDGAISFEELQAQRPNVTQEQFTGLDADKNGTLSREELRSGMGRRIFSRLDADNSGGVSFDELAQRMPQLSQERFNKLDKDGNGQLSQGELSAARPPHRGPRPDGADGARRGPFGGQRPGGAGGVRPPRPRPEG